MVTLRAHVDATYVWIVTMSTGSCLGKSIRCFQKRYDTLHEEGMMPMDRF